MTKKELLDHILTGGKLAARQAKAADNEIGWAYGHGFADAMRFIAILILNDLAGKKVVKL